MRKLFLTAALVAISLVPAVAQTSTPMGTPASSAAPSTAPKPEPTSLSEFARSRVDALFTSEHADASVFSASFLAQVPVTQVDAIIAQLKAALGQYKSTDGAKFDYTAHFEKGTAEVLIHLDAQNKIDGLFIKPPKLSSPNVSLDNALRILRTASGDLSYVIIEGRSERAALNASQPLAVGSAFKLAVLAAMRDQIDRGRRHWSDVATLDARWKSLPSGILRTWPDATPITLATYAAQMISISDNTAADALVHLSGPAALAPYAGRNTPFLTTREAFILKSTLGVKQRSDYLAATTPEARARVLRVVDAMPLPTLDELASLPILSVEWHYSVRDLCTLMGRVATLPLMAINPGVAEPASFRHVAFKGGSDTGVINLTTQVMTKRGTIICLSATLNDAKKNIDDRAFASAYSAVLSALADR
ncbi:MAG: serine hydrolase [Vulcanimicrobiaceae bacterium]